MKKKQLSLIIFIFIQLYIFIALVNFNKLINQSLLSVVSSTLCFIMTCFIFCKTKDYYIMFIALLLTVIADIFMNYFSDLAIIYLIILNTIQLLYFLRTYLESEYKKLNIIVRISTIIIISIITCLVLKERTDVNALLWTTYIVNIFLNILFTIKDIGINNFFPIGLLILFIHGSLMMFLGIENYTTINVPFINFLQQLPFNVKAITYVPAQVILTCSVFTVNRMSFSSIGKEKNPD